MGDEDKQFEASQQKLRKARKEGQVVKSKDFSTAISLIVMFLVIYSLGSFIWTQISGLFSNLYEQIPNANIEVMGKGYLFFVTLVPAALIIVPIICLSALVSIIGDLIQVGPLFTMAPLTPKPEKLNPTKYFKNLMNPKTLFELVKNIAKVLILGLIGYMVYMEHFEAILGLAVVESEFATLHAFGSLITDFILKAGIAFLIIAAMDYGVTKWKFMQDQKMSFKEVKDEYKNSEGDPHVKAALRQKRQQLLRKAIKDSVPDADFVVTNPIHVACAVKYDAETMESPTLLAKGAELFAKEIKEIAIANDVPVIENPPVARALYRLVEVNRQIPPDLYKAVAEILIFVYNSKKQKQDKIKAQIERMKEIQQKNDENYYNSEKNSSEDKNNNS